MDKRVEIKDRLELKDGSLGVLKRLVIPNEVIEDRFSKYEPPIHSGLGLREQLYDDGNKLLYSSELNEEKLNEMLQSIFTTTTGYTTVTNPSFYGYSSTTTTVPVEQWKVEILDFGGAVTDNRTPLEKALANRFKILS